MRTTRGDEDNQLFDQRILRTEKGWSPSGERTDHKQANKTANVHIEPGSGGAGVWEDTEWGNNLEEKFTKQQQQQKSSDGKSRRCWGFYSRFPAEQQGGPLITKIGI